MIKRLAVLLASLLAAGVAMAEPVKTGHATAEIIAERAAVVPGDQYLGALKLDLEAGWHVYWKNAGDSGEPPQIEWKLPDGVTTGDFSWPAPHAIPIATLMNYGYEKQVVLPFQVNVPSTYKVGDKLELKGHAQWLICSDVCVPEQADLSITLPVEATPRTDDAAGKLIADALAATPKPATGEMKVQRTPSGFTLGVIDADMVAATRTATSIRFYPDGSEIENAAKQKGQHGDAGVSIDLQGSEFGPKTDGPLLGAIVIEAKDGSRKAWEIKATPGALPAGVTGKAIGPGAGALGPIALLGILGAAFLGGLVLNLMPCVLPVLSIKAAGLVHTAHDPKESRAHGLFYTAGVVICFLAIGAILVALRAAGEQAGLGFQLQYPPLVAVFALLMFGVGLNMLGVFEIGTSLMGVGGNVADKGGASGAFFTGLLAAFVGAPCVGPFMAPAVGVALSQPPLVVLAVFLVIGLGLASPFLLLSFTPALAKLLPKPGKWMATFRQVLAFPMFLTAIWMLWILAAQAGSDGVILVVGGATVLAFGIWLADKIGKGLIGRGIATVVILAAFIAPAVLSAGLTAPADAATATASAEVDSKPWSPQLVTELQGQKKVIFVDFTARWCATCQVNKKLALESAAVKKAFADHDVAFLVADWTNRDGVIAEALAEHERAGVPLYLVYPADGGPPVVLPQVLSPGLVVKAVKDAAGAQTAQLR
ncbi:MAG: protein-disulfide reductase DsbD domain-containing protein [Alphaproteobacteria bacterium]